MINLDEKKAYKDDYSSIGKYMEARAETYFKNMYTEKIVSTIMPDMRKEISEKMVEVEVFIIKNNTMYYLETENLNFKFTKVPEELLTINTTAHGVFEECFKNCYRELKEHMANFNEEWKELNSFPIVVEVKLWDGANGKKGEVIQVREFEDFLKWYKERFSFFLKNCLEGDFLEQIATKITKAYEEELVKNEPFMIIETVRGALHQRYAVSEDFIMSTEKIEPLAGREKVERIISDAIPDDYHKECLTNIIWNETLFPLEFSSSYKLIKIIKITDEYIYGRDYEEEIHIVDFSFRMYYCCCMISRRCVPLYHYHMDLNKKDAYRTAGILKEFGYDFHDFNDSSRNHFSVHNGNGAKEFEMYYYSYLMGESNIPFRFIEIDAESEALRIRKNLGDFRYTDMYLL